MAPVEITDDYYAILEVSQTANAIEIKKSYHRLAILLHPDKNQNKPNATASFKLLNRAYETLKDEASRRIYDIQWPHITKTYQTAQEKAKREAEAAKTKSEKSAKERAARESEEQKSRVAIELLTRKKQEFASKIFEIKREVTRLQSELKNIETLEKKALAEDQARNGWLKYAYSSVFGAPQEPEGAKDERDRRRLQRGASKTIKENELSRKENMLKECNALLSGVEKSIAAELKSRQERELRAEREREEARRREQAKAWKKQQDEFMERERASRAAAEARAAKERAAAEVLRQAAEERRMKEEEERRNTAAKAAEIRRKLMERQQRKMEEERERKSKEEEERRKNIAEMLRNMHKASAATSSNQTGTRTRASGNRRPTQSSSGSCRHQGWWDKVEQGSLSCESCHSQRRWLLECPSCQMRACAGCRKTLQEKGRRPRKSQPPGAGPPHNPPYEEGVGYDAYDWY